MHVISFFNINKTSENQNFSMKSSFLQLFFLTHSLFLAFCSLYMKLQMKSSPSLPPYLQNLHYQKRESYMNLERLGLLLLWLLGITAIFILCLLYSPNPFSVTPRENLKQQQQNPLFKPKKEVEECDLFTGRWIPDLKGPLYTNRSCPTIPDSKNCARHGRKDVDFLNWRWKPNECELQRFDSKIFLRIVQGKKLAFIGDSVARNQMESLLCLLSQEETPTEIYRDAEDRFRTWYFPSHDFTLMILWSKFLVNGEERVVNGSLSGVFDLHLNRINDKWAHKLHGVDYAVISDGHWFFRKTYLYDGHNLVGCIFCNEPNVTELSIGSAIGRVFRATFKYINDCNRCGGLLTLLRTFSPAHFENGTWDNGGHCNRTSPLREEEVQLRSNEMEIGSIQIEEVQRARKEGEKLGKRFGSLDITRAMLTRADGHPSSHWNNQWMKGYNDCVHWCLPGPIDAWNDLLMAVLIREKDGSPLGLH